MQPQFERKIAPDVQRFAHFFKVVSDKKQLTGALTEEDSCAPPRASSWACRCTKPCGRTRARTTSASGRERRGRSGLVTW